MSVQIINPRGRNPIFCQYSGQYQPQPAFIELDCDLQVLRAGYSGEIGNAVPASVYDQRILRWRIDPHLTCRAIRELFRQVRDDAELIIAGFEVRWNGSNHVGTYSQEAQAAIDRIYYSCENIDF